MTMFPFPLSPPCSILITHISYDYLYGCIPRPRYTFARRNCAQGKIVGLERNHCLVS